MAVLSNVQLTKSYSKGSGGLMFYYHCRKKRVQKTVKGVKVTDHWNLDWSASLVSGIDLPNEQFTSRKRLFI